MKGDIIAIAFVLVSAFVLFSLRNFILMVGKPKRKPYLTADVETARIDGQQVDFHQEKVSRASSDHKRVLHADGAISHTRPEVLPRFRI